MLEATFVWWYWYCSLRVMRSFIVLWCSRAGQPENKRWLAANLTHNDRTDRVVSANGSLSWFWWFLQLYFTVFCPWAVCLHDEVLNVFLMDRMLLFSFFFFTNRMWMTECDIFSFLFYNFVDTTIILFWFLKWNSNVKRSTPARQAGWFIAVWDNI